jgi:hypothetical protein
LTIRSMWCLNCSLLSRSPPAKPAKRRNRTVSDRNKATSAKWLFYASA